MIRAAARWAPAVLWAALIFFLSSGPRDIPAPEVVGIDKVLHFGAYGVLGFLLARGRLSFALTALIGILYGASDEVHQMFVPGRSPSVFDWIADAAGVLAGVYLYTRWRARRPDRKLRARGDAGFVRP